MRRAVITCVCIIRKTSGLLDDLINKDFKAHENVMSVQFPEELKKNLDLTNFPSIHFLQKPFHYYLFNWKSKFSISFVIEIDILKIE